MFTIRNIKKICLVIGKKNLNSTKHNRSKSQKN